MVLKSHKKAIKNGRWVQSSVALLLVALLASICFAQSAYAQTIDASFSVRTGSAFQTIQVNEQITTRSASSSSDSLRRSNFKSPDRSAPTSEDLANDEGALGEGSFQQGTLAHTVPTSTLGDNQSLQGAELSSASIADGVEVGGVLYNDLNRNNVKDNNEPGIRNVDLEIYADTDGDNLPDGLSLATANSGLSGNFRFSGLADGDYVMSISPTFFASGEPLDRMVVCPPANDPPAPIDPDNDIDGDNNGVEYITTLGVRTVRTLAITLNSGAEPIAEDDDPNTNLTVDLCMFNDTINTPTLPNGEPDLSPEANDDEYLREIDMPIAENILVNDVAGNGPLLVKFLSGTLPPGVTLNAGGDLVGTPTQVGVYVFEYQISDYDGDTDTATVTIRVEEDLLPVAEDDSEAVNVGDALTLDICANDFVGSGFGSVAYVSGDIAAGLTLVDCILSGNPTTPGVFIFDYVLTDIDGDTSTATVTIDVNALPVAVDDSRTISTNRPFALDVCANDDLGDGFGSVTYVSGNIPPGLTLTNCILNGTPTTPGVYVFEYELADVDGDTDIATVTINVNLLPDAVDDSAITSIGDPFTLDICTNDDLGDGFGSITLVSGVLAPGLNLADCQITGTPTTLGEYVFNYELTDANGDTDIATVTITVGGTGTITIVKQTTSGDSTFSFSGNDSDLDSLRITTSNGTGSSPQFAKNVGTYTISENPLIGWKLDSISISGDTDNGSSTSGDRATIDLDPDENIVVTFIGSLILSCADGSNNLGGIVWRDFNSNGIQDDSDVGFFDAGIRVYAFDSSNRQIASTALNSDGTYLFGNIFTIADDVRVEFSGLPSWAHSGVHGTDSGTMVQVHGSNTCTANLAVQNPADYCEDNAPNIGLTCLVNGQATSAGDTFVTFEYDANGKPEKLGGTAPNPVKKAEAIQTGSVWGVAFQRSQQASYIGAAVVRHIGLGPMGTGGIYRVDASGVTDFVNLNGMTAANGGVINTGSLIRSGSLDYTLPLGGTEQPSTDLDAWDAVGKRGLGDIDMSEDDQTLWAVNLFDRSLISVDVSGTSAGDVNQYALNDPGCVKGEFRPWALSLHNGRGFVGIICDANSIGGTHANLHAYVLSFDPANPAGGYTKIIDFALDYGRTSAGSGYVGDNGMTAEWQMWADSWGDVTSEQQFQHFNGGTWSFPQPILSALEFTENGSLVLGFADRAAFQGGFNNSLPVAGNRSAVYSVNASGDILYACNTDAGLVLEGDANCQRPGGGSEFFSAETFGTLHEETHLGALAYLQGSGEVVSTNYNPRSNIFSQGIHKYGTDDGALNSAYELVNLGSTGVRTKGAALGDMELFCQAAPIEIGNYVWQDENENGVQDPNETGISNLTVALYDSNGGQVANTTTNSAGQYYFNDANVSGRIQPFTTYQVRIDLNDSALAGKVPTHANSGWGSTSPDAIDSDGLVLNGSAIANVTTAGAGQNDHTIDFGFRESKPIVACRDGSSDLGGKVWRDFNSNGVQDEIDMDFFYPGITVRAFDASNAEIASTSLNRDGTYVFENIFDATSDIRVEFSGLPSWAYSSVSENRSGTTVQVHSATTCRADLAVQNPADYCQSNPLVSLACMENGLAAGNTNPAFVTMDYQNPTTKSAALEIADLGAVWGAAYHAESENIYLASMIRRHSGLANGPGYIYVIHNNTILDSINLQGIGPVNGGSAIDLGSVCRRNGTDGDADPACDPLGTGVALDYELPINPKTPNVDLDAFDSIGKVSFGDIDVTEDGNTLWAVNLHQRALISMDVHLDGSIDTSTVSQYLLSTLSGLPTCRNGVFRPWALEFNDGAGYLGGVCSGENGGTLTDLSAYVLTFDPMNIGNGFITALSAPLDYTREPFYDFVQNTGWKIWVNEWSDVIENREHSQPIFSDIAFMADGSMVLGLADRFGLQLGDVNFYPFSGATIGTTGSNAGDILYACEVDGAFILEGNQGCIVDNDQVSRGSPNANDGPGGVGEFFYQDDAIIHFETSQGALVVLKQNEEVLLTRSNPTNRTFTSGVAWYSTVDGTKSNGFEIVSARGVNSFGKSANLSDMVAMCQPAPIEIGNYVWQDSNRNGIQDPNENGLTEVTVGLYNSGNVRIATAVTNGQGEYTFNDSNVPQGLDSYAQYQVKIELAQQTVLGLVPTQHGANASMLNPDLIDSDGVSNNGFAVADITTSGAGRNNHSVDFGLTTALPLSCGANSQEAEDALLSGAFVIATSDDGASGGQHIWVPSGTGNEWNGAKEMHMALFCIEVDTAGLYHIVGTAKATNSGDDSFFITLDGLPENGYLWDVAVSNGYVTDKVNHRRVADPVEVILSAGQHLIGVHLREDGTRLDKMALELVEALSPTPTCGAMEQEAEQAALHGNFLSYVDELASGGRYAGVAEGTRSNFRGAATTDRAEFCFNVPQTGVYKLVGTVQADTGNNDSFYVTVDGQPASGYLWDTRRSRDYITTDLNNRGGANPVLLNLAAGPHTVVVYLREDGTKLDKLALVSSTALNAANMQTPNAVELIASENIVLGELHVSSSHAEEPELADHTVLLSSEDASYETTTNHIGGYYIDNVAAGTYNLTITAPTAAGETTFEQTITVDESGSGSDSESVETNFEYEPPMESNDSYIYLPAIR